MFKGTSLVKWVIVYTKQAQKDAKKIARSGLKKKVVELIEILESNPYQTAPPYEKLVGDLTGAYSRRIKSLLPSSGVMNPNPLALLKNFTVPLLIIVFFN